MIKVVLFQHTLKVNLTKTSDIRIQPKILNSLQACIDVNGSGNLQVSSVMYIRVKVTDCSWSYCGHRVLYFMNHSAMVQQHATTITNQY